MLLHLSPEAHFLSDGRREARLRVHALVRRTHKCRVAGTGMTGQSRLVPCGRDRTAARIPGSRHRARRLRLLLNRTVRRSLGRAEPAMARVRLLVRAGLIAVVDRRALRGPEAVCVRILGHACLCGDAFAQV
ncbi:hypothetical protein GCM10022261_20900 [Brevibacterium daeguense]|uniref:Uncharacterized protein n=1 Tax=Brevibacterium daeguense TaxID=909936 RepID=A0ABP8EKP9_9MICO